jgi:succinyl-diaminopimelate desuccinylase
MEAPSPSRAPQLSAYGDLQGSITALLAQLVRIPSRAGIDSYDRIFGFLLDWLRRHDVPCDPITARDGRMAAIAGQIGGVAGAAAYVLNATVDTAGFGDLAAWTR